MGFLKKLFGNVEKANKGEISAEEIIPPFTVDLVEEADDYWRQMEQSLLINAVKADEISVVEPTQLLRLARQSKNN